MIKHLKNMLSSIFSNKKNRVPILTWDETQIVCNFPDDETKYMKWKDLKAVVIETTDEGPWMEDVYFVLFADEIENSFSYPQCSEGNQTLLEKLMELPMFDENAVIKAMGCTSNKSFLCWEEPGWKGKDWPAIKVARNY